MTRYPNASFRCYMWHAITLAQLGRADEAREAAAETIRLRPDFSLKVARRDASGHVLKPIYIDSLRAAGVPE